MIILLVALVLVVSNLVHGGIVGFGHYANRAMTSAEFYANYKIPEFDNVRDATVWAYKTKYQEPIRRLLKHKMAELMAKAQPYAGSIDPLNLKIVSYYMSQWDDCRVALRIIEEYKKQNKNGDWAMVAKDPDYSIPHFRSVNEASQWAHERSFNAKLFRMLKNKMMNYEITLLQNGFRASDKQAMSRARAALDQYEALSLAVTIFRDHRSRGKIGDNAMMNVGASVYAGSHPVERNK